MTMRDKLTRSIGALDIMKLTTKDVLKMLQQEQCAAVMAAIALKKKEIKPYRRFLPPMSESNDSNKTDKDRLYELKAG